MAKRKIESTKEALKILLSGRHPQAKKFAGKQVMVVKNVVLPLAEGKKALEDLDRLEKKYGERPTLVFVPRQDISYILLL
jgi:hypothetical protein